MIKNKITVNEAVNLAEEAYNTSDSNKNLRFGQALTNSLPDQLFLEVVGTEHDLFYEISTENVIAYFYKNYVENGE